jgi:hypothetical protein
MKTIIPFLEEVYEFSDKDEVHSAGDRIFDFIQGHLRKRYFETCKYVLSIVDTSRLNPALLVTFLSTTFAARDKLQPSRDAYYAKVFEVLSQARGIEAASKLLGKYR